MIVSASASPIVTWSTSPGLARDRGQAPTSLRRCPGRAQQHGGLGERLEASLERGLLERGDVAGEEAAAAPGPMGQAALVVSVASAVRPERCGARWVGRLAPGMEALVARAADAGVPDVTPDSDVSSPGCSSAQSLIAKLLEQAGSANRLLPRAVESPIGDSGRECVTGGELRNDTTEFLPRDGTLSFLLIDSSYGSLVKKQELRSENNVPAFSNGQRCSAV